MRVNGDRLRSDAASESARSLAVSLPKHFDEARQRRQRVSFIEDDPQSVAPEWPPLLFELEFQSLAGLAAGGQEQIRRRREKQLVGRNRATFAIEEGKRLDALAGLRLVELRREHAIEPTFALLEHSERTTNHSEDDEGEYNDEERERRESEDPRPVQTVPLGGAATSARCRAAAVRVKTPAASTERVPMTTASAEPSDG